MGGENFVEGETSRGEKKRGRGDSAPNTFQRIQKERKRVSFRGDENNSKKRTRRFNT